MGSTYLSGRARWVFLFVQYSSAEVLEIGLVLLAFARSQLLNMLDTS